MRKTAHSDDPNAWVRCLGEVNVTIETEYHSQLQAIAGYDYLAFAEFMSPSEPPEAKHHIFMGERLMDIERGDLLRLMVSMPPGYAKSHYCSVMFPAWYLGRNPTHKFMQVGHTQIFCNNRFGKPVRNLIASPSYKKVFPGINLSPHSKAADFWELANPNSGSYLARGAGGGISGFRANCTSIDDPFKSREDAESQTIRDKVFDWYSGDLIPRLLPYAPIYIVATRWHSDDLCGRVEVLSNTGVGFTFTIINLPCIYPEDADGPDPLGRQPGEVLWPQFYSEDYVMKIKATTPPRDWNSLYQGTPMDETGGMINFDELPRYSQLPSSERIRRKTLSVDTASKKDERNDFTVLTVWYESDTHQHYLAEVIRKRVEFEEMVTLIESTARRHGVHAILVEDRGSGTQYIQTRRGKAPAPVIDRSTNNQSKEFRFDAVVPMFLAEEVVLPDRAIWLADFEKELGAFPHGTFKDQVDSVSQYLEWARQRTDGGTKRLVGGNIVQGGRKAARDASEPVALPERAIMSAPIPEPGAIRRPPARLIR